jgi:regulator of protease activity HflC (stomatin/prohibitin superfamily)
MPADLNDYFNKKKGGGSNTPKKSDSGGGSGGNGGGGNPMGDLSGKPMLLYILVGIAVLLFVAKPYTIINSGEVGIKATAGEFEPAPLHPGFHVFIPGIQKIIVVDTKVRSLNYTTSEDVAMIPTRDSGVMSARPITALDARGLVISVDITVQYNLKPESAPQTISTYGLAWEEKIINPIIRDVVRSVIGKYKAEELPIKRTEIAKDIDSQVRMKINNKEGEPVILQTVNLREIILPDKIREQIERVQIAKQEGDRVKLEVERAKQEAEKVAALAKGEADARRIKAEGQAAAVKIEADAQAYANDVVAKSLTGELIELKQIEVQGMFNDALRVNKDAKIFLTPGGSTPNIWVDTKNKQQRTSAEQ